MADNMEGLIHQIETGVRGEDVRDAIINAINNIAINRDANTLEGHSSSYFAKQSDMTNLLPVASTIEAGSSKPAASGAVYNYVEVNVGDWLNNVLGERVEGATLRDKLINIYAGKNQIIGACVTAGVQFTTGINAATLSLSDIASAIERTQSFSSGDTIDLTLNTLNVTENNTDTQPYYEAEEGTAFNKVSVHVAPKLSELSVNSVDIKTLKQTFEPDKDTEYDGYSKVTVDISRRIKELNINSITAKGTATFKVSDVNDEDDEDNYIYGYSKINVDLSSQLIKKEIDSVDELPDDPSNIRFRIKDENKSDDDDDEEEKADKYIGYSEVKVDITPKLKDLPIEVDASNFGEEQTFVASEENVYGYHTVVVKVVESEGPFTVTFYNGRNKLLTVDDVEKNQDVQYVGETPTSQGKVFSGWNPKPENVTHNLDCYAQFKDAKTITKDHELENSWAEIGSNGGVDIPLGGWKVLYYKGFTYEGKNYEGGKFLMQKVGEGEDGTTSTWVSLNSFDYELPFYENGITELKGPTLGWETSWIRNFINNGLYNAIKSATETKYGESGAIAASMQEVIKNTSSFDYEAKDILEQQTSDRIWIPSWREMVGGTTHEFSGPTYTYDFSKSSEFPSGFTTNADAYSRSVHNIDAIDRITSAQVQAHPDELKKYEGQIYRVRLSTQRLSIKNGYAVGTRYPYIFYYINRQICQALIDCGAAPTDDDLLTMNNTFNFHIGFCT